MDRVISLSLGELMLKGKNRKYFEDQLIRNIKRALRNSSEYRIYKEQGKIYIEGFENKEDAIIPKLEKIFGIIYISKCIRTSTSIEDIREASLIAVKEKLQGKKVLTFKVEATRANKNYPLKSTEICPDVGEYILEHVENLSVDVHNPEIFVYIDIKKHAYIYIDRTKAYGGFPIGTNGKGLLLLSGGIDSPVAGFLMAKRGVEIAGLHFHSYPFTSERAEQKMLDLASILSIYTGPIKIYSVNLLKIQKEINQKCAEDEMTIISRRFMMRIAERLSEENNYNALITGENLGQVASQTIGSINVINRVVNMPILRPLIGMDKQDIIEWAKDIETFETSIIPFEDCCSVFLPKHPLTRPKVEDIEKSESNLEIGALVEEALENIKVHYIK
ncbi:MAG: tRNA uracil 4-sulfurtransferase ThiI [Gudongella sp.]|nr:tRNA uracil 4-sulfurtransferase ThiI [Gudongella sp.]